MWMFVYGLYELLEEGDVSFGRKKNFVIVWFFKSL